MSGVHAGSGLGSGHPTHIARSHGWCQIPGGHGEGPLKNQYKGDISSAQVVVECSVRMSRQ